MMNYLYYPGCSLKGTGIAYEESLLAVMDHLGIDCPEIDDWNCCGATAYMSINEKQAHTLAARNLALAEMQGKAKGDTVNIISPCNACYLVLSKAAHHLEDDALGDRTIVNAMHTCGLEYEGNVAIRHPLDVFVNDVGLDRIQQTITKPLTGYKIACYYGCQVVRPFATFDDQYNPITMDSLMEAMGADTVPWAVKTRCCGGSLMGTVPEIGQRLSYILLKEAQKHGANAIVTACPLCQFNLECYQNEMSKKFGEQIHIPVVYFTQMMGRAMGITDKKLGLQRSFVPLGEPAAV
jgi:heterodisulfide reductase subunit B